MRLRPMSNATFIRDVHRTNVQFSCVIYLRILPSVTRSSARWEPLAKNRNKTRQMLMQSKPRTNQRMANMTNPYSKPCTTRFSSESGLLVSYLSYLVSEQLYLEVYSTLTCTTDTLTTTTPLVNQVLLTWLTDSFAYYHLSDAERTAAAASGFLKPRGIGYGIGLAFALFVMQGECILSITWIFYIMPIH